MKQDSVSSSSAWLERVISGSLSDSLMLLNTAACGYTPTKKTSIHSNTEARLVHDVCQALIKVLASKPYHICIIYILGFQP